MIHKILKDWANIHKYPIPPVVLHTSNSIRRVTNIQFHPSCYKHPIPPRRVTNIQFHQWYYKHLIPPVVLQTSDGKSCIRKGLDGDYDKGEHMRCHFWHTYSVMIRYEDWPWTAQLLTWPRQGCTIIALVLFFEPITHPATCSDNNHFVIKII